MEIIVEKLFLSEFRECTQYALLEFGKKTMLRWNEEYFKIRHRLELMPESYSFVPELLRWRKYRGAIIMKNFKVIYFYEEETDVVRIVDLWDMRQNPEKLRARARKIEHTRYN